MGAFKTWRGYPVLAPDGKPWTLGKAIRAYGVPVPRPVVEMASCRTTAQFERERDAMAIQSKRNWARSRRMVEQDAAAREWEASHGAQEGR